MTRAIIGSAVILSAVLMLPLSMLALITHNAGLAQWLLVGSILSLSAWLVHCSEAVFVTPPNGGEDFRYLAIPAKYVLCWLGMNIAKVGLALHELGQFMASLSR